MGAIPFEHQFYRSIILLEHNIIGATYHTIQLEQHTMQYYWSIILLEQHTIQSYWSNIPYNPIGATYYTKPLEHHPIGAQYYWSNIPYNTIGVWQPTIQYYLSNVLWEIIVLLIRTRHWGIFRTVRSNTFQHVLPHVQTCQVRQMLQRRRKGACWNPQA